MRNNPASYNYGNYRYRNPRQIQQQYPDRYGSSNRVERSTLINPTIINSDISDSVLINPVIIQQDHYRNTRLGEIHQRHQPYYR